MHVAIGFKGVVRRIYREVHGTNYSSVIRLTLSVIYIYDSCGRYRRDFMVLLLLLLLDHFGLILGTIKSTVAAKGSNKIKNA